ncbi:chemotaxis protein CheD [Metabacillus indicus]
MEAFGMEKQERMIKVGIAEKNIVSQPYLIRTSGLGSCVGLVLYDEEKKTAGLVHIMLPDSSLSRTGEYNPSKYADTAVKDLAEKLAERGCRKGALKAKLAGGAQMFPFQPSGMLNIGTRNVAAVLEQLDIMKISVISMDTGGSSGRTIEFNPATGKLSIFTVNQSAKTI